MKRLSPSDREYIKQLDEWTTSAQQQIKAAADNASKINMAASFFFEHLKLKYGLKEEDTIKPDGRIILAERPNDNSDS